MERNEVMESLLARMSSRGRRAWGVVEGIWLRKELSGHVLNEDEAMALFKEHMHSLDERDLNLFGRVLWEALVIRKGRDRTMEPIHAKQLLARQELRVFERAHELEPGLGANAGIKLCMAILKAHGETPGFSDEALEIAFERLDLDKEEDF